MIPNSLPSGKMSIKEYVTQRNARLIIIVREPGDVVHSLVKRGGHNYRSAVCRWAGGIDELHKAYNSTAEKIVIDFSHMLDKPEEEMNKVCDFLNISFENNMLDGYKGTPQYDNEELNSGVTEKAGFDEVREKFSGYYEKYVSISNKFHS
jgi:hypothetical protein